MSFALKNTLNAPAGTVHRELTGDASTGLGWLSDRYRLRTRRNCRAHGVIQSSNRLHRNLNGCIRIVEVDLVPLLNDRGVSGAVLTDVCFNLSVGRGVDPRPVRNVGLNRAYVRGTGNWHYPYHQNQCSYDTHHCTRTHGYAYSSCCRCARLVALPSFLTVSVGSRGHRATWVLTVVAILRSSGVHGRVT